MNFFVSSKFGGRELTITIKKFSLKVRVKIGLLEYCNLDNFSTVHNIGLNFGQTTDENHFEHFWKLLNNSCVGLNTSI